MRIIFFDFSAAGVGQSSPAMAVEERSVWGMWWMKTMMIHYVSEMLRQTQELGEGFLKNLNWLSFTTQHHK